MGKVIHQFQPYVRITQYARHSWEIRLYTDPTGWCSPTWYRFNRAAAIRKGERALARYKKKYMDLEQDTVINL